MGQKQIDAVAGARETIYKATSAMEIAVANLRDSIGGDVAHIYNFWADTIEDHQGKLEEADGRLFSAFEPELAELKKQRDDDEADDE